MENNPFKQIRLNRTGQEKSLEWYREQIRKVGDSRFQFANLQKNKSLIVNKLTPGGLYLFSYDPKLKDTLPFYDTLPLVFPYKMASNGFIGYNIHYLPYQLRFKVMETLLKINTSKDSASRKALSSYTVLQNLESGKYFSPCIKRYLNNHITSQFIQIPQQDWITASMLPIEQFQKQTKQQVWKQTRESIRG